MTVEDILSMIDQAVTDWSVSDRGDAMRWRPPSSATLPAELPAEPPEAIDYGGTFRYDADDADDVVRTFGDTEWVYVGHTLEGRAVHWEPSDDLVRFRMDAAVRFSLNGMNPSAAAMYAYGYTYGPVVHGASIPHATGQS